MDCPFCRQGDTKVLESRFSEGAVRRRRECEHCTNRFTTYERTVFSLTVIKKDGREQPFQIEKIAASLRKACSKTDPEKLEKLTREIECKILGKKKTKIPTSDIGKIVMAVLKKFDKMSYVRYASVYKAIHDPKLLERELQTIV